jgi:hypothetical protein
MTRLTGNSSLAYVGVQPASPTNFTAQPKDPTTYDWQNFYLGDEWLNSTTNTVWKLVSLSGNLATWVKQAGTNVGLQTLTGNSGGAVSPTLGNINVVGDGTSINIVGTPGTSTLTATATGTFATPIPVSSGGTGVSSFTPYAVITGGTTSTGPLQSVSSVGTSGQVLTSNGAGELPSFQSTSGETSEFLSGNDASTASPAAGVITFTGAGGNTIHASGSTVTITGSGSNPATSFITSPTTGTATPSSGVLTFAGTGDTTVSASGSTVTINSTGTNPASSCSFFAYNATTIGSFGTIGSFVTVPFTTELFDLGSNYSTGTNTFTAPNTGYYQFSISISVSGATSATTEFSVQLLVSGTSSGAYLYPNGNLYGQSQVGGGSSWGQFMGPFVKMTSGDTAVVQFLLGPSGGSTVSLTGTNTSPQYRTVFSGFQVA